MTITLQFLFSLHGQCLQCQQVQALLSGVPSLAFEWPCLPERQQVFVLLSLVPTGQRVRLAVPVACENLMETARRK